MSSAAKKPEPSSAGVFLQVFAALQAEYAAAIHLAAARGDQHEVARLASEMAEKIKALPVETRPLALVEATPPKPILYDQKICSLDLDLTVYDGDRDAVLAFLEDEAFMTAATRILSEAKPYNARKNLLKTGLKLTPKIAPKVFDILRQCQESLGLIGDLDLYVTSDVELNAFCFPPQGGRFIIGVTSSLLEKFDESELAFVLGHEIGHALFRHSRFPARFLLERDTQGEFSPLHAMRLFAWKRNAEISADRVGLICSKNFDAAARAFFKLSSGVTTDSLSFQLREYVDQFRELSVETNGEVDPEDWYSTHPFSPMRVKALDMFHRSENYLKLIGREDVAEISEAQLELEIKKFMAMMEPAYLSEGSDISRYMRDFIFTGGFLVAAANGDVDASEITALGSLLDGKEVATRLAELNSTSLDDLWERLGNLCQKLNVMIPVVSKLNVIKDLTIIAGADGSVDQAEIQTLYRISANLQIRPEFVDHCLESSEVTEETDDAEDAGAAEGAEGGET